jgi:AraC-like DNA-binding protein
MKQRRLGSILSAIMSEISLAKPEELAKYNVNTLARLHGISAPNLCRAFQTRYRLSLGQYLRFLRVYAFEEMLKKDPYMTVKEALKRLDIQSSSHFGQQYKIRRGITPKEMALKCQFELAHQRYRPA